jgi:hypothetical protein
MSLSNPVRGGGVLRGSWFEEGAKHELREERCGTCRFWQWTGDRYIEQGRTLGEGQCRIRAPFCGGWPRSYEYNWCGEHQPQE